MILVEMIKISELQSPGGVTHDHKGQRWNAYHKGQQAERREDQGDFICRTPGVWIINHGVPKGKVFMGFIA